MSRRRRLLRYGLAILAVAAGAGAVWLFRGGDGEAPRYRFAEVERGPLKRIVSASGTLRAVVTVEIGSQVSGQIAELRADYNTNVAAGQVLARLDPAPFETQVAQAGAERAVAEANLAMQRAALGELTAALDGARTTLAEAERELARKSALLDRRIAPQSQIDKARAARDRARASVDAAAARLARHRAQIAHARAQVDQREAALRRRELDLDYSVIRSPVDGVVIGRNVDVGQTVAASFQAPVLFTVAQDLSRMQVEVSVDEADIGQVARGQPAAFTVDTFSDRRFAGRVEQIRKAPREVSNVVTYTVVVSAGNPDLSLLPGMTANVNVVVAERGNVLKVDNAALRFRAGEAPEGAAGAAAGGPESGRARARRAVERLARELALTADQQARLREIFAETGRKTAALRAEGASREEIRAFVRDSRQRNRPKIEALLDDRQRESFRAMSARRAREPARPGRLWVLGADGAPKPVPVAYGISDGAMSEILRGGVEEGDRVIVGVVRRDPQRAARPPRFGL